MSETPLEAALRLQRAGETAQAAELYRRILRADPRDADALYRLGLLYGQNGKFEEAQQLMGEAAKLRPGSGDIFLARGYALQRLGRREEALRCFDAVLERIPNSREALLNRAAALFGLRRYEEAATDYDRLLAIDPEYPFARGNRLFCRLHCCDWRMLESGTLALTAALRDGKAVVAPFDGKALALSPEDELLCARIWVAHQCPPAHALCRGERYRRERIRIVFVAADFPAHPAAPLLAGVIAGLDTSRFETAAISLGPDRSGEMQGLLRSAFGTYLESRNESDGEIATRIRQMEADIAVDLMGFTDGCRPGIFAQRPAPVQVNYLGYPGTMGAAYMDYLIADPIVVPPSHEPHYAEKIVTMPYAFMPQDRTRAIGPRPSRADAGLPEQGFVFCAFNNVYKIAPRMFDIWMRLLQAVEGSVLWLTKPNETALRNLKREAELRGVAPERLVFAPFVEAPENHLARLGLADLFLDTLPYNAHAIASDALWAGVPILTCGGDAFAGRVASSLLSAIGLPETIAGSLQDYEDRALKLARDPAALAAIRAKLWKNRDTQPLFDTQSYARQLAAAFACMHERQFDGKPPAGFAVDRSA